MIAGTADNRRTSGSRRALVYFGPLTLLFYLVLPHSFLLDSATSYMLKDNLHAGVTKVSSFRLLTALPVYFSFAFGLLRDRWSPFGLRDRGFLLLFAPISSLVFLWMAFSRLTYLGLFMGMVLVMISYRFIAAAFEGLLALVGQEKSMSGRLSALWNVISLLTYFMGAIASGYLNAHLSPRHFFILVAGLASLIGLMGFWKPADVFRDLYERPQARSADFIGNIKRLAKHKAVYPAVMMTFLFQFSPGSSTPLQFYLTDKLHTSNAVYGYYSGIFAVSFVPVLLFYGYICTRVPLNKLLWWGTIIAIPQMIPLALVHSVTLALILAVPMGLMGGIAQAAYFDAAMRSCPAGLQGTLMMMVAGAYQLSFRGGDFVGSWIYNSSPEHGFLYCALVTSFVYSLILPLILLVPKELLATSDGQPNSQFSGDRSPG
jgi:MFS family permease